MFFGIILPLTFRVDEKQTILKDKLELYKADEMESDNEADQ